LATADLLVSTISLLANYREEGRNLSPDIFICKSISQLVRRIGSGESIVLGAVPLNGAAAAKALKEAAPLAVRGWAIFFERETDHDLRYGLFAGSMDPSAIGLSEIALEIPDQDFPVVLVRQLGPNKVEIRSNSSRSRCFQFDGTEGSGNTPLANYGDSDLEALAECISEGAPEDVSGTLPGLIKRIISEALQSAHGTLIAVTSAGSTLPESLRDILKIHPIIDLAERLQQHRQDHGSASSLSSLQAAANLIQGMIASDGITVFEQGGRVVGYRAFIQTPQPSPGTSGGARTRAFKALSDRVGQDFLAAFYCSQDGAKKLTISSKR